MIADEVLSASIYRLMLYMLKVGLVGKVGSIATLSEMQFAEKCWLLPHEAHDTGRAVTVLIVSASGWNDLHGCVHRSSVCAVE